MPKIIGADDTKSLNMARKIYSKVFNEEFVLTIVHMQRPKLTKYVSLCEYRFSK